jgi:hypothetical protein
MHPRRSSTTLLLVIGILLAGLLAGCGGGDQSGNGSQDGKSGGEQAQVGEAAKKRDGEAVKKGALKPKIALGTITRVKLERRRITLRAVTGEEGAEPMPFKIAKNATITLDDEEAELADIKDGQQAQITYVVRNEVNVAREVSLISGDGGGAESGENTS